MVDILRELEGLDREIKKANRLTEEKVLLDGQVSEKFSSLKEQYKW